MKRLLSILSTILICFVFCSNISAGEKAVQVESLWNGITNSNGLPLSSGKVYTYAAGTDTVKATYTNVTKTTPAANPIILDSEGRALIFADGLYKFVIKDSDGNTLYTRDNLSYFNQYYTEAVHASDYGDGSCTDETITTAQTAIGSDIRTLILKPCTWVVDENTAINANVNLKPEAGAVLQVATGVTLTINGTRENPSLQQIYSLVGTGATAFGNLIKEVYPEEWGVNTTPGTTDMTAEINACLAVGATCVLTDSIYLSDGVTMDVAGTTLQINGSATLRQKGGGDNWGVRMNASNTSIIGNGVIDGNYSNLASFNAWGIYVKSSLASLSSIYIGDGLKVINTAHNTADGDGIYVNGSADGTTYVTGLSIKGAFIYSNERQGIAIIAGRKIDISGNVIHDNTNSGIDLEPNQSTQIVREFSISNNHIYDCAVGIGAMAQKGSIIGNTLTGFTSNGITIPPVVAGVSSGNIQIIGNDIADFDGNGIEVYTSSDGHIQMLGNNIRKNATSTYCIYMRVGGNIVANNYLEGSTQNQPLVRCLNSGGNLIDGNRFIRGSEDTAISLASTGTNVIGDNYYSSGYTNRILGMVSTDVISSKKETVASATDITVDKGYYQSGTQFTNTGASGTTTVLLPAATANLEYTVVRTASFEFRADPNGTEIIRGGTAGQYVILNVNGEGVILKCIVDGVWEPFPVNGAALTFGP